MHEVAHASLRWLARCSPSVPDEAHYHSACFIPSPVDGQGSPLWSNGFVVSSTSVSSKNELTSACPFDKRICASNPAATALWRSTTTKEVLMLHCLVRARYLRRPQLLTCV